LQISRKPCCGHWEIILEMGPWYHPFRRVVFTFAIWGVTGLALTSLSGQSDAVKLSRCHLPRGKTSPSGGTSLL